MALGFQSRSTVRLLSLASFFLFIESAAAQQIVKIEKQRPAPAATAEDTADVETPKRFVLLQHAAGLTDFHMGMGTSWGDYNGDGFPDVFIAGYHRHPDILYRNKGDGTFAHADTDAGVAAGGEAGFGCAWADYDDDGDLDLYVVNANSQQDFLWQNNSDGTFKQVAQAVGMGEYSNNYGAAWTDYDGDGRLDLFLAGGEHNKLYHNLGNGTFSNVTAAAGLDETAPAGYGVAWGDYDGDKDMDLFVTSSKSDHLYRNNGNGTFTNVTAEAGVADAANGMGAAFCDYDNDGDLDLYVANYGKAQDFLYRNNGDGTFAQVAEKSGMADAESGRGVAWGDYDNDGDFDLFVATDGGQLPLLYRNNGNGTFTHVTKPEGMASGGWGIGAAWVDYDNDGDVDLYLGTQVTHLDLLFHNRDTGVSGWIKINPLAQCPQPTDDTGPAKYRLAIGARVEIDLDGGANFAKGPGRYITATVGSGDGLAGQAIPVHFGVGSAKNVDVRVTFPTGHVVRSPKIPVRQTLTVKDR